MRSHCYEIKYSPTNQARALVTGMLVILLIVIDQSLCTSTKTDTEVKRGPLQVTHTATTAMGQGREREPEFLFKKVPAGWHGGTCI